MNRSPNWKFYAALLILSLCLLWIFRPHKTPALQPAAPTSHATLPVHAAPSGRVVLVNLQQGGSTTVTQSLQPAKPTKKLQ